eukprot:NODE_6754_length_310_cov_268.348659_g5595_i0.p2 GENE.NODE_6754_length_310_cov_268.348659_g5595_i0~~NODE_6754_length_310_cov_268.348659_g5595_i0.p2  ORF type:complete len:58 (+),score=29.35 NODE_6754_length_310_cov_268.348659_g5595_i0:32-175(+)
MGVTSSFPLTGLTELPQAALHQWKMMTCIPKRPITAFTNMKRGSPVV